MIMVGGDPRLVPGNRDPSFGTWLIATISLVLPWFGIPIAIWGALRIADNAGYGWVLLLGGIALLIADVYIDFVWAASPVGVSDDPTLNKPGAAFVGRLALVEDAIVNGRGKVRIGDTLWLAEGPDTAKGAHVRITGVSGTVLTVARDG